LIDELDAVIMFKRGVSRITHHQRMSEWI